MRDIFNPRSDTFHESTLLLFDHSVRLNENERLGFRWLSTVVTHFSPYSIYDYIVIIWRIEKHILRISISNGIK